LLIGERQWALWPARYWIENKKITKKEREREQSIEGKKEMRECIDGVVMIASWLRRLVVGVGG